MLAATVTVRLSEDVFTALTNRADSWGLSPSATARRILEENLFPLSGGRVRGSPVERYYRAEGEEP